MRPARPDHSRFLRNVLPFPSNSIGARCIGIVVFERRNPLGRDRVHRGSSARQCLIRHVRVHRGLVRRRGLRTRHHRPHSRIRELLLIERTIMRNASDYPPPSLVMRHQATRSTGLDRTRQTLFGLIHPGCSFSAMPHPGCIRQLTQNWSRKA